MAEIRLDKLRKDFGTVVAVNDITLTFPEGTVTCLLGPSGCGKTTLMRMIGGLDTPTSGDIYFDSDRVTDLTPSERNIGMVFQYPVVYRGMSAYRNIELPLLEDKSISRTERKARVESVIDTLDLGRSANTDVSKLDNGTRQKVAVARAVARQPRIILFDEPITNVDIASKVQLKRVLKRLVKQHNQTIIYVTHDQTEAMTLADEIALMRDGVIVQRGAPREVYDQPNDRFGGWFLGNPGMNFIEYRVRRDDGNALLTEPLFNKPTRVDGLNGHTEVVLGIRPEHVHVYPTPTQDTVEAKVVRSALVVGGQHLLTLQIGDLTLKAKVQPEDGYDKATTVYVACPIDYVFVFERESGQRLAASVTG
ncbi:MAG: ABC transporter ATP-binding protein [Chloroflexi bacterium]|nr:ABC transporter ATP-binding protein [Chloroflexota bacterium]